MRARGTSPFPSPGGPVPVRGKGAPRAWVPSGREDRVSQGPGLQGSRVRPVSASPRPSSRAAGGDCCPRARGNLSRGRIIASIIPPASREPLERLGSEAQSAVRRLLLDLLGLRAARVFGFIRGQSRSSRDGWPRPHPSLEDGGSQEPGLLTQHGRGALPCVHHLPCTHGPQESLAQPRKPHLPRRAEGSTLWGGRMAFPLGVQNSLR